MNCVLFFIVHFIVLVWMSDLSDLIDTLEDNGLLHSAGSTAVCGSGVVGASSLLVVLSSWVPFTGFFYRLFFCLLLFLLIRLRYIFYIKKSTYNKVFTHKSYVGTFLYVGTFVTCKKCTNMDVSIVFTCYKCTRIQKCTHMSIIFTCKKCTHITFMWVQFILYGYTLCEITLNLISYICYYTNVLSNCLNNNRMKKIIHI